jgi:hypothetical protein
MNTATQPFVFLSDPGHGWLRVPLALVNELAIGDRISRCSYRDDEFAYLEQDCDAAEFLGAWTGAGHRTEPLREIHSDRDSFVRQLRRFGASR